MNAPPCHPMSQFMDGACSYCGRSYFPTHGPLRSQKATGINLLPLLAKVIKSRWTYDPIKALHPIGILQEKGRLQNYPLLNQIFPFFARPCPTVPRHGFVDSRIVNSVGELEKVFDETIEADPNGEVLCCGFIDSKANAVLTPTMLTIGDGYDGATSGKNTINIPLVRGKWWEKKREDHYMDMEGADFKESARIGPDDDPYIEAVLDAKNIVTLTQLRGGPRLESGSPDFIPDQIEINEICQVDPKMSLLDWEKLIISIKDIKGLVIYHPGGSPVDHFSVHARSFNIPVITTFKPEVGMILQPIERVPLDPESILDGIGVGDRFIITIDNQKWWKECEEMVNFALFALHNSSAFQGKDGFWLGVGVAFMLRLGITAMQGEARHCKADGETTRVARESVYEKVLNRDLKTHRMRLTVLTHILRYGQFPSQGIGGRAWATCGVACGNLINSVSRLATTLDQSAVGELIRSFNVCVNQAHNGGWWLNKFAHQNAFDDAAEGVGLVNLMSFPFLYNLGKERGKMDWREMKYDRWRPLQFKPVRPREVKLVQPPSISMGNLHLKVSDRILKGKEKGLTIEADQIAKVMKDLISGKLVLRSTSEGRQLVLVPSTDPIVLWKETPLDLEGNQAKVNV